VVLFFVAFFLFLFLLLEGYRIKRGIPIKEANIVAKPLIRPHEKRGFGGHVFFAAGAFVAVLAYAKEIAIASLLMATLADGGAAVVGSRWGRRKLFSGKTLEGFLTFILIGFVVSVWLVKPAPIALAGAIGAACVELLPINDNLTVPIAAGLVMHLARYLS
jgi:dolichol kinase